MDIATLNAHIIHKKLGGTYSSLQFRLELIQLLFSKYGESTEKHSNPGRLSTVFQSPARLTGRHFLEDVPMEGNRKKRRQCVVCIAIKKRTQVSVICEQCQVPLCPTQCFKTYHTKLDFSK